MGGAGARSFGGVGDVVGPKRAAQFLEKGKVGRAVLSAPPPFETRENFPILLASAAR